jgi:hypothetical protein
MGSLYDRLILPKLLACACSSSPVMRQRAKVVPRAAGRVLELGIGLGLNLGFYDPDKVSGVTGVDPAAELRAARRSRQPSTRLAVDADEGSFPMPNPPRPAPAKPKTPDKPVDPAIYGGRWGPGEPKTSDLPPPDRPDKIEVPPEKN